MGRYDGMTDKKAEEAYLKETKANQEAWIKANEAGDQAGMDAAHENQVGVQKDWDDFTGGVSTFDASSGVWHSTNGTSTRPGAFKNDITSPYYNRKSSPSYTDYEKAKRDYETAQFSYDPQNDPGYRNYQKQYTRLAGQAMDDTLSRVASRTGGLASSYAATAGELAYNNQMAGLTDRIPELERLAYDRFLDEQSRRLRSMQIAENEMDKDERAWEKQRAAYLEEEGKKTDVQAVMQTYEEQGWDALTDAEKRVLYQSGSYYDDKEGALVDRAGNRYRSNVSPLWNVLYKFRKEGYDALTDAERDILYRAGGYYDAEAGEVVDREGNRFASSVDPLWEALFTFQTRGREALSKDDARTLADAGYTYDADNDWYIDPSGKAFGRDSSSFKEEKSASAVALSKYQNGVRLTDAEMRLLAEQMTQPEIAEMIKKNSLLK